MNLDAALQTFFIEAREMLEQMESLLLQFENGAAESDPDRVNAIFRAAHTIKGSAGIFSLHDIVAFTHVVESVLDTLREGRQGLESGLISLLLHCCDHMGVLVERAEQNPDCPLDSDQEAAAILERGEHLLAQLQAYLHPVAPAPEERSELPLARFTRHLESAGAVPGERVERLAGEVDNDNWHIFVRFGANTFRDGMDPLSFILFLKKLGRIDHIAPLAERLPSLSEFDPETCYLAFEIQLDSNASRQEIEDVFEFMREEGELHILPPRSALGDYLALIEAMPNVDLRLGEMLIECGAVTEAELARALQAQQIPPEGRPLGEILTEHNVRLSPVLEAALQKQNQVRESVAREQKTLRVDADKLDTLINCIGELVTAGAGTVMQAEALGDSRMLESVTLLNTLLEEVRDAALKLRMVPIGATFGKFQRVVRDIAQELGKDVELIIHGADTELDKSVVEKIGDPLMHLVRNALDHGIEAPDVRVGQGKTARGQLLLNAYHDSGNIVIEVSDDGKGIDPEVIRRKGIEKGLIGEAAVLSRDELLNLIFEPGFSTAAQVSNLSGRGVGMDVVRRNITELRGHVAIHSEPGQGSTMRVVLPLTLAIIDGFLIGVGDDAFVVPLELVQECVELDRRHLHEDGDASYINLRGEVLPLVNLRQHFELGGTAPARQSVVVVRAGGLLAGLIVDRLMGEFQTDIKPLGKVFGRVSGLSGSTILGTGRVALILDVQGLVQSLASFRQHREQTERSIRSK
jgi:two-component system chemotaxis sensor kinase CheA